MLVCLSCFYESGFCDLCCVPVSLGHYSPCGTGINGMPRKNNGTVADKALHLQRSSRPVGESHIVHRLSVILTLPHRYSACPRS